MEEAELVVGRHDEQSVRLRHRAGHLREELRAGDPDGDRQTDLVEDSLSQPRCDLQGLPGEAFESADVEERLVDRQPLDEQRRVLEDREHGLARLGVGRHPRGYHDRLRAESARLAAAHGGPDPVCLRLVARCQHDPAADDHRPPSQASVIALLDRGEESVEVGVQDRRGQDEHMFALRRRLGKVGWGVASAQHWDEAYTARGIDGVSWYEPIPAVSLELVEALGVSPEAAVIGVGGGGSFLADELVGRGFTDITVLDISAAALAAT